MPDFDHVVQAQIDVDSCKCNNTSCYEAIYQAGTRYYCLLDEEVYVVGGGGMTVVVETMGRIDIFIY